MKYLFTIFMACLCAVSASAETAVVNTVTSSDAEKIKMIATLEEDLLILDSEIAKCEKAKKGWVAATVVGSAGVVATGVAAGVQGAKIAEKKGELGTHSATVKQKEKQLKELTNE